MLLAGGAAARFGGRPKGLATLGGRRVADQVLAALRATTDRQCIVANDPRAAGWFPGERVVRDRLPGLGPLAGLATALDAAEGDPVLVVAWDMPFVAPALLAALCTLGGQRGASVVPVHGEPPVREPLCAYYRPEAGAVARALLATGERRGRALFDALQPDRVSEMDDAAIRQAGDPRRLFTSIDTPEHLAALGGMLPSEDAAPTRR